MRKVFAVLLVLPLLLCGCERESLTDPVLFCRAYNRAAAYPVSEDDAYLRGAGEVLLYAGQTLLRLQTNEDGAIHTAVVTGEPGAQTSSDAQNAFAVLAQPLSEPVPQQVAEWAQGVQASVQTAQTKRFTYLAYGDAQTVTLVQINRLLCAIPDSPTLRLSAEA